MVGQLALAPHLGQKAAHGLLVFALALVDRANCDQPIEGLPDRHWLVGLDDAIDGIFEALDHGLCAASSVYRTSLISRLTGC